VNQFIVVNRNLKSVAFSSLFCVVYELYNYTDTFFIKMNICRQYVMQSVGSTVCNLPCSLKITDPKSHALYKSFFGEAKNFSTNKNIPNFLESDASSQFLQDFGRAR
jgi:hypothetical protein